MAKITDLPALAEEDIDGSEVVPVVKGGANFRATVAQLSAEANAAAAQVVAARDAAELYKTGAEDAQAGAQAAAAITTADRAQTGDDRATVRADRLAVENWTAEIVRPLLTDFYDANGQLHITAYVSPIDDHILLISEGNALADSAGYGISGSTGKLTAIGRRAGAFIISYDSSAYGWNSNAETCGDFHSAYGVHANEKVNKPGRAIHGFGTRATGSATFAGDPTPGKFLEIGGKVITFVAGAPGAGEVQVAAGDPATTIDRLVAMLIDSADTRVDFLLWRRTGTVFELLAEGAGEWGNEITLSTDDPAIALSGATLTGGATQLNTGNPLVYIGGSAFGVAANKNASPVYGRPAQGGFKFSGRPGVGEWFILGIGDTIGTTPATSKQITFVDGAASTFQVSRGASRGEDIRNAVDKLRSIQSGYTELNRVEYWSALDHLRTVYKTNDLSGNLFKTEARSPSAAFAQIRDFMFDGFSGIPNADVALGMNSEWTIGGDNVKQGYGAGRFATAVYSRFGRTSAGGMSTGNYNDYGPNCGADLIGSYNAHLGAANSPGATIRDYIYVTAVSADGVITLSQKIADPVARIIGQRLTWNQINAVLGSDLIKGNGSNIQNPTLKVTTIAPDKLQIIDSSDTDVATVYSVAGVPGNVQVAPKYAMAAHSGSRYDIAEDRTEHLGTSKQRFAKVMAEVLRLPNSRMLPTPIIGGVPAIWRLPFPNALANLADGDTVAIQGASGLTITLKSTANMAVANTNRSKWVELGANMSQTLQNIANFLNTFDDGSAGATEARRARYWVHGQSGFGFYLYARIVGDSDGNTWAMACSNAGAGAVAQVTTGTTGNLPLAASIKAPGDNEITWVTNNPRLGQPGQAMYSLAGNKWRF